MYIIYIISKFMNNTLLQNKFEVIKLTGQSCKIELFRDSLKEFIPGRFIQFKRVDKDISNNFDLKMTCIDGCIKYLYDKRHGFVKVELETKVPALPYQIVGYTHKNTEVELIRAFDVNGEVRSLSRNITDLTLKLYLKDVENNEKYSYTILFKKQDFKYIEKEQILNATNGKIRQSLTDDIVEYEVRFFVWSEPENIAFKVVPIYRENENLYIGVEKFVNYENICRFKLMVGFDLRDKHKSFEDIETEFDTINYVNSTWAGKERESINLYITKRFVKEAMESKLENMEDIVFCYMCINEEKPLNIELIEQYIKNRQNIKKEVLTKEEIYKYLAITLNDIKNKRVNKESYFEENKILLL